MGSKVSMNFLVVTNVLSLLFLIRWTQSFKLSVPVEEVVSTAGEDIWLTCGEGVASEKVWLLVHEDKDNEQILRWKRESGVDFIAVGYLTKDEGDIGLRSQPGSPEKTYACEYVMEDKIKTKQWKVKTEVIADKDNVDVENIENDEPAEEAAAADDTENREGQEENEVEQDNQNKQEQLQEKQEEEEEEVKQEDVQDNQNKEEQQGGHQQKEIEVKQENQQPIRNGVEIQMEKELEDQVAARAVEYRELDSLASVQAEQTDFTYFRPYLIISIIVLVLLFRKKIYRKLGIMYL